MNDKPIAAPVKDTSYGHATGFNKVTVEGELRVVLVESPGQKGIFIEGRSSLLPMIEVIETGQEVVIRAKKNRSFLHSVTVYVPVHNLHTVNIKSNADVSSPGILYSGQLNVYINGNCSVSLKVLGRIHIIEGEHFYFIRTGSYERNSTDHSISPTIIQTN